MKQYLKLADKVMKFGHVRKERTGTGTISVFGPQLVFDLREGFPAVTTKSLFIKGVWIELLWFLSGETSAQYMIDNNVAIWDEWMMENNDLGPVYGVQWRKWRSLYNETTTLFADDGPLESYNEVRTEYIDQLQKAIDTIRNNPTDRRIIVTAWNPGELDQMALPPCHLLYQFYVEDDFLDIKVYQRSADVFLGLPFDIASYATLVTQVAYITGKIPRQLIYTLGDTHIYSNHVEVMVEQLMREPYDLPIINVNTNNRDIREIDDFVYEDFSLEGYKHHPKLTGVVSK